MRDIMFQGMFVYFYLMWVSSASESVPKILNEVGDNSFIWAVVVMILELIVLLLKSFVFGCIIEVISNLL